MKSRLALAALAFLALTCTTAGAAQQASDQPTQPPAQPASPAAQPAKPAAQPTLQGQKVQSAPAGAVVDQVPPAPPPGAVVNPNYVIGPGDTVQVFVWRNAELSVTVPVRPDGKISTPLVEDMVAVGKTSSQLARDIEKVLAEYVRAPQVNIIVTNPVSTFSQVRVIGQVTNPQAVPYREGLTALDAILAVGGLTEFAAGNRAKIVRKNQAGKTVEIKIKLEALVKKGRMAENKDLQPGDVIIVPESFL
jgi:polysaccharide export outer membrane protein